MKKTIALSMALLVLAFALVGCQKKAEEKPAALAKDIVADMVEKKYVTMPVEVDDTIAADVYHLNLDDVESYGIAVTGISPGFSTVIVVQAKEGKVEDVKKSVDAILADRVGNAFYPAEMEAAEKAKVSVDGNYVSLMMLDAEIEEEAMKMYNEAVAK